MCGSDTIEIESRLSDNFIVHNLDTLFHAVELLSANSTKTHQDNKVIRGISWLLRHGQCERGTDREGEGGKCW